MRVKRTPALAGSPNGHSIPSVFSSTHRDQPTSPPESAPFNTSCITRAEKAALKQKEEEQPQQISRSTDQQSLFALDIYDQVPSKPGNILYLTNTPHVQQVIAPRLWCGPDATAEELRASLNTPVRNVREKGRNPPFDPAVAAVPFKTIKEAYTLKKRVKDEEIADDLQAMAAAIQRSDAIAEATAESSSTSSLSPSSSGRWAIVEDTPATQVMEWSASVSPHREAASRRGSEAAAAAEGEEWSGEGKGKGKEEVANLSVRREPAATHPSVSSVSASKQQQQQKNKKRKTYDEDEMVRREQDSFSSKSVRRPRQRFDDEPPRQRLATKAGPCPSDRRIRTGATTLSAAAAAAAASPPLSSFADGPPPLKPKSRQQRPIPTALLSTPAPAPAFPTQNSSSKGSRSRSRSGRLSRRHEPTNRPSPTLHHLRSNRAAATCSRRTRAHAPPTRPPMPASAAAPTLQDTLETAGLGDRHLLWPVALESNVRGAAAVDADAGEVRARATLGPSQLFLQEARVRYVMEGRERVVQEWLAGLGLGRGSGGGGGNKVEDVDVDVEAEAAMGMLRRGLAR